jgi:CO/xanthine dehydrogenase FAD-binding subunit
MMLLPSFDYHRPAGLAEAMEMLAGFGGTAKLLAGGTDLFVNMKHGQQSPAQIIDLDGLGELKASQTGGEALELGTGLKAAELADGLGGALPRALSHGAGVLGSPQVRNRASLGGNLATARPAGDLCVPLLALGARLTLNGPKGAHQVELPGFFQGPGQTTLAAEEILVKVLVEKARPGSGSAYCKLGLRKALEISLVSAASWLSLEDDGKTIKEGRVALGAVAPTPMLSEGAAQALSGAPADEKTFEAAAAAAAADAKPINDHRGSAEYRRDMVAVLTKRCLAEALANARGN